MNKTTLGVFAVGVLIGSALTVAATFALWSSAKRAAETQAMILSVADQTHSFVPILINLHEHDLELLERGLRTGIVAGVSTLDTYKTNVDEETKERVVRVLQSIAAKRSRLGLGQYAEKEQPEIEAILSKYDRLPVSGSN